MSQAPAATEPVKEPKRTEIPNRLFLIPYPKIVFLYPTFLTALAVAIFHSIVGPSLTPPLEASAIVPSVIFLAVFTLNIIILGFDFPRTTSLMIFFLVVAVALGLVLLFVLYPDFLPILTGALLQFQPTANAAFFWAIAVVIFVITVVAWVYARFDCWEARPNELLHHHGLWGDLERFPAPGTRIDKEINDVFEYLLLRSGRLILHPANERRPIILDNVPFIRKKEAILTRMLGALQVDIRDEPTAQDGTT
jgi:hypothetical protein